MARSSTRQETRAGLSVDQSGRAGDGDVFLSAGDGEAEFEFGSGADIHMELRSDLRRHVFGDDAGGVVARRQQVDGEAAFSVGGGRVACAGSDVHHDDAGAGNAEVVQIDDRPWMAPVAPSWAKASGSAKRMQRVMSEVRGMESHLWSG